MRNLLVTGGAGFIGANFVHHWLVTHPGDVVVVLDALTYAGNLASLEPARGNAAFHFVHGDIVSEELVERLLREYDIDTVVHFAAESHVDRSIHEPDAFVQTNLLGTHALLKAARRVWLEEGRAGRSVRFHHVSTDEVYGSLGPDDPPCTESAAYAPNSPYAASKAGSDHLVRAYGHTFALPVTTSNCSNNYGPYQFPEKLIPLMIVNLLEGKPLPIYGDGLNVRDWLFVTDHCLGIEHVLERGRLGETYNLGGKSEWRNIEIVRLLCSLLDEMFAENGELRRRFARSPCARGAKAESLITFVRDRPGHDRRYALDTTKARTELGFVPQETLQAGLRQTVCWYLEHESWWRGVMDGSYRDWISRHYG